MALIALLLTPPAAHAEGWAPGVREPVPEAPSLATAEAGFGGAWAAGLVPPFRAAERDRLSIRLDARGWIGPVRLALTSDWLRDSTEAGEPVSGFGDVRLGTALRLFRRGGAGAGLGWEAKLPNAADEGELGTDETDVLFGVWGGWEGGGWGVGGAIGLGVLGNPLRFANQDDVPMLHVQAGRELGFGELRSFLAWDLATSRNPSRAEAGGALRVGRAWFVEAEGAGGLTAAAPDWRAGLRVGWAGVVPRPDAGEAPDGE